MERSGKNWAWESKTLEGRKGVSDVKGGWEFREMT